MELKSFSFSELTVRHSLLNYLLLPSFAVFFLHTLTPGGIIHSHHAVITVLSGILCLTHTLTHRKDSRLSFLCVILIGTCSFFVLAILFGANPLRYWSNLSWSFFLTSLVLLPSLHVIGYNFQSWIRVFLQYRFDSTSEMCVYVVSLATLVGAWVGTFPILLDWNRPWQVWPIPSSMGALIGNLSGHLFSAWINWYHNK